jgi:hypothetical protein
MISVAKILTLLLSFHIQSYDANEPIQDRTVRLEIIAQVISDVSKDNKSLAAFLIGELEGESGLRKDIQNCKCPPHQCDEGLAMGPWQSQRTWGQSKTEWKSVCGESTESVTIAATREAKLFSGGIEVSLARAGGNNATPNDKWVKNRAKRIRWIMTKL